MFDELDVEVRRRAARVQAYRDLLSVPVVGGWRRSATEADDVTAEIVISCSRCGRATTRFVVPYALDRAAVPPWSDLATVEQILIRSLEHRYGCTHLAPLLGADSPEIETATQLALLEG